MLGKLTNTIFVMSSTGDSTHTKCKMGSKFIEGHVQVQEYILFTIRDLISEKGETTEEVQTVIDQALEELSGWYEMREMFS